MGGNEGEGEHLAKTKVNGPGRYKLRQGRSAGGKADLKVPLNVHVLGPALLEYMTPVKAVRSQGH